MKMTQQSDYTDEQLAAGLKCVEIWRNQNGVLSDESLCGMIFDAMRAAAPAPTAPSERKMEVFGYVDSDGLFYSAAHGLAPFPGCTTVYRAARRPAQTAPSERKPFRWAVYFKRRGDLEEDVLIVHERCRAEKEVDEKLITRIVPLYE
jgi:hypothetical protein